MNRLFVILPLMMIAISVTGCIYKHKPNVMKEKERFVQRAIPINISTSIQTYPYMHNDVATLTDFIIIDSHDIDIDFSKSSNRIAVDSLRNLRQEIFRFNSGSNNISNIYLVGKLSKEILQTPNKPGMLTSVEYREFRLDSWYIKTPFKYCTNYEKASESLGDIPYKFDQHTKLSRSDFKPFPGIEKLDLKSLTKP